MDVTTIPQASDLQTQLALIETAIDGLNAGQSVTNLTVSDLSLPVPGLGTRVIFEPALSDETTVANVIAALQSQQTYLISQLEQMGYTYSGTAIPSAPAAPAPQPAPALREPEPLPPLAAMPEAPPAEPPVPVPVPEDASAEPATAA